MLTALLSLVLCLPTTSGDPVRRERLPAEVDFVMHLDLEGFKTTNLYRMVLESEDMQTDFDELGEIEERFGLDPLRDLRAFTLFKVENEEEPTVVLLSTSTKVDAALEKLKHERGYRRLSEGAIELHTWKEEDHADESVFAYLHGAGDERVVVLASQRESAVRAARVLRGELPSLAKSGTGLTVAPAEGSFLYMSASDLSEMDEFAPASQVFGLAQGLQFDVGEAGGFLRAHVGVTTKNADDAFELANVVNGFVSLARLAGREAGEALELLTGLKVQSRGTNVTLDFEYELERLVELLGELDGDDDEPERVEPVDRSENEKVRRR
jgi:hypothetical protein